LPDNDYEALVATHVAAALERLGLSTVGVDDLTGNAELCRRDLALLGLGSLDWIAVAAELESATGRELPDRALVESERRCVKGWAQALSGERNR
jgi:acyl carrier protein